MGDFTKRLVVFLFVILFFSKQAGQTVPIDKIDMVKMTWSDLIGCFLFAFYSLWASRVTN